MYSCILIRLLVFCLGCVCECARVCACEYVCFSSALTTSPDWGGGASPLPSQQECWEFYLKMHHMRSQCRIQTNAQGKRTICSETSSSSSSSALTHTHTHTYTHSPSEFNMRPFTPTHSGLQRHEYTFSCNMNN